jgi:putative ABC transport system permease protein
MARELSRRPGPTILGALGLSAALAINVIGRFSGDVIEEFVSIQFSRAMREDRAVTLRRDVSKAALDSVRSIDGVRHAEAQRVAPVELVNGHRARRRVLVGHSDDSRLRRRVDRSGAPIVMPASGLSIDDGTAEALGVRAGDSLVVRPLEGGAPPRIERVGAVFAGITALEAHAPAKLVDRILGNERINVLLLEVDPERGASVARVLDDAPEVLAVAERTTMIEQFRRLTGETMSTMTAVLTVFATIIAVGVVYNDARILLSSAAHDLATLRVLGFTRAEVRRMLLGQLALEVTLALVPGLVLGTLGAKLVMSTVDPEVHRFPTIVSAETSLVSALVVVGAALGSALVVGRRIDRLDLVRVLKTKE